VCLYEADAAAAAQHQFSVGSKTAQDGKTVLRPVVKEQNAKRYSAAGVTPFATCRRDLRHLRVDTHLRPITFTA